MQANAELDVAAAGEEVAAAARGWAEAAVRAWAEEPACHAQRVRHRSRAAHRA